MREAVARFFGSNLPEGFYFPEIRFVDIIEIMIINGISDKYFIDCCVIPYF